MALGASAALCAAVSLLSALQPDACAAVLVLPRWVWLAPGLLLVAVGWRQKGKRYAGTIAALWLVYAVLYVEEIASLARWRGRRQAEWQSARARGEALRVISLNCGGGDPKAAAEMAGYQPDIVLLQESPPRSDVEQLATQFFGAEAGVLCGLDASIIVRGQLAPVGVTLSRDVNFAQARVRLTSGLEVEVISVRLPPLYDVRMDLWSPACWRAQAAARRTVRQLMVELARRVEAIPRTVPIIVGGDFNAPGRDGPFRVLGPRLHDAFAEGGLGWGNTLLNELPVVRIDQIWLSGDFRALSVVARRTLHSDHRAVVCDLVDVRNP